MIAEPSLRLPSTRRLAALLVPSLGLVTYGYLFQLTKPSALSIAGTADKAAAAGYMVVLGIGVALLAFPIALAGDELVRRLGRGTGDVGTLCLVGVGYAVGVMFFVENFLYTVNNQGLKTQETPVLDVVYVVLGFSVGLLGALRTVSMSATTARWVVSTTIAVGVVGLALVVAEQANEPSDPHLAGHLTNAWNVVVLSADGVNADQMSVYGYARDTTPFLNSKQSEFSLFENAFSNNGNTTGSIVSLLNGRSPLSTDVVYPPDALSARDATKTLPYLLGRLGYRRENWAVPHYADARDQNLVEAFDLDNGQEQDGALIESLPLGKGPARWLVHETLHSAIGVFLDALGVSHLTNPYGAVSSHVIGDILGDDERLEHIVGALRGRGPVFVNAHFMVTHGPSFTLPRRTFSHGKQERPWETDFYDDAILTFDGYVEKVYEELERSGELERTLLVVTSDHGAEWDATKRIPLLIRFPASKPAGRVTTNVERLDVAPTVLRALGLAVPHWMSGMDLAQPEKIPEDRTIVSTTAANPEFLNDLGVRSRADGVTVTTIRCTSFVKVYADGDVDRGPVLGSSATCPTAPTVSDAAVSSQS